MADPVAQQSTPPLIYPDACGAWSQGEASYPAGPELPPAWWPYGPTRAYLDGRWHACWTSAERERANADT